MKILLFLSALAAALAIVSLGLGIAGLLLGWGTASSVTMFMCAAANILNCIMTWKTAMEL